MISRLQTFVDKILQGILHKAPPPRFFWKRQRPWPPSQLTCPRTLVYPARLHSNGFRNTQNALTQHYADESTETHHSALFWIIRRLKRKAADAILEPNFIVTSTSPYGRRPTASINKSPQKQKIITWGSHSSQKIRKPQNPPQIWKRNSRIRG